jgi:hypothetical protein
MPHTFTFTPSLPIGTRPCGFAAAVRWQKPRFIPTYPDHDTIICVTVLLLPVFPLKAYHTYNWSRHTGHICDVIPIRRTRDLLLRAMLRPYLIAAFAISLPLLFIFGIPLLKDIIESRTISILNADILSMFIGSGFVFILSTIFLLSLRSKNIRNRDIRLILGRHQLGSSDPAMWTEEVLASIKPSTQLFGTDSELEAGRKALNKGRFAHAMLAARLAVAKGESLGKELTDEILQDARVRENIHKVRKKPWRRQELFPEDAVVSVELISEK